MKKIGAQKRLFDGTPGRRKLTPWSGLVRLPSPSTPWLMTQSVIVNVPYLGFPRIHLSRFSPLPRR